MQRPELQDKLNIVMHEWDTMQFASTKHWIWPKCLADTQKLRRLQQLFFLAVFPLAEFFSSGFSAYAENMRLAAKFGGLGVCVDIMV